MADGLVVQARQGSPAALDALIERLSHQLWADLSARRKRRRIAGTNGSSDLVQDTVIRVRDGFEKFQGETFGEFTRWARTILFRRRLEWARNRSARNEDRHRHQIWSALKSRFAEDLSLGHRSVERREEADRVLARFGRLKPNEQFVIDLHLIKGLTFKEIGQMTNRSEDAARKAFDRAMSRLKRMFTDDEE